MAKDLLTKFTCLPDVKIKEGSLVGPQIRYLMMVSDFRHTSVHKRKALKKSKYSKTVPDRDILKVDSFFLYNSVIEEEIYDIILAHL